MTTYNKLRQILTDRLPHLKELSFGCENGVSYEIMSRPPSLQDVLLAIGDKRCGIDCEGQMVCRPNYENRMGNDIFIYYDLTLPLSQQSDETLLEIIKLIE